MKGVLSFLIALVVTCMASACCNKDKITYPDSLALQKYLYFDEGSWWEFEGPAGAKKRFTAQYFKRTAQPLSECGTAAPFFLCGCEGPFDYAYGIDFGAENPLTPFSYLGFGKNELDRLDGVEVLYEQENVKYDFFLPISGKGGKAGATDFAQLLDSTVTLLVKGESISNIREFRLNRYDSTLFYLAPNIGPVLVRLSNGSEWKLVDYNIIKPDLN